MGVPFHYDLGFLFTGPEIHAVVPGGPNGAGAGWVHLHRLDSDPSLDRKPQVHLSGYQKPRKQEGRAPGARSLSTESSPDELQNPLHNIP